MSPRPAKRRVNLTDISSRAWEHPADQGALVALRKLKGFDKVLKAMSGLINERAVRLELLGSAIRVDERQFAVLHRLLAEVGATLDAPELPELYVRASPLFNGDDDRHGQARDRGELRARSTSSTRRSCAS